MSQYTLSALYTGLLSLQHNVDFSILPHGFSQNDLRTHLQEHLSPYQWNKLQEAKPTTYNTPFITIDQPTYPAILKKYPSAPPVLFYRGNIDLLNDSSIAIVGSRHCSKDSLSFTSRLSAAAYTTHSIIGGLTFGIEEFAHQTILSRKESPVRLIAVLEQGVDCLEGHRLRWMTQLIERGGLVLSTHPPDRRVQKWHYKHRNHLIAMLAEYIVVIEAAKSSGSISTALSGVELGKEVYAVPHHPNRINGHGCLQLIEQGAHPLWDPKTIFETEIPENKLLDSLCKPQSLQEIVEAQHSNPSEMLEALLELKRLGYIRQRGTLWERI